ncbi:MAG: OmpH family outer membrane protein [Xanthomonadales bacterium]|nr:OmpH family outer membrane protein [Xanthomonadales bacterium]
MSGEPAARCRRFGWLLWPLFLLPSLLAAQAGSDRIAYVDMQRLIDSAPQVVAARARLQAEFAERDRALDVDASRLAELDDRIRREADLMSADDARALRQEADALRSSIQRTRERLSQELNTRIDQELDKAWPDIESSVAEYAREAGYDLVVGSPVIYASGRIDITDRVLDRLRRGSAERP